MSNTYQALQVAPTDKYRRSRQACRPERVGIVRSSVGLSVDITGLKAATSDIVHIGNDPADQIAAEVVAVTPDSVRCMPLEHLDGITVGTAARLASGALGAPVGPKLRGRVINGLGEPIDGRGPLRPEARVPVDSEPPNPLLRQRVDTQMALGVRALDTLVPVGRGQRMGLFAGSGVGKSSLLSMIARGCDADTVVLCLVGERGREVREFIEDDLGQEGLDRSVVVVSTSDQPAAVRLRAAKLATRTAEYYRDQGHNVLLMMDSLTRFATAQREIGLSTGEPPATRGYPPSVFSMLARLLERGGPGATGSITGIYTVLVDGDDMDEPIADAARSILDGHVLLSRKLTSAGHFPSVDVLDSVSRVATRITTPEQRQISAALRAVMAARNQMQDLIDVGAYAPGSNPAVDAALHCEAQIAAFLQQDIHDIAPLPESWLALDGLVSAMINSMEAPAGAGPGDGR